MWSRFPSQGKTRKQNRRPISLLRNLKKNYERNPFKRLSDQVFADYVIPEKQCGIIPGYSTTQQLLRLTECISSGLHRKCYIAAVFLNISEACGSTWHTRLLYKLIQMCSRGADKSNRLSSSSQGVQSEDGAVSKWKPMLAGLPLDSTLFYITYINPIH
jgi:hypothetical protein